MYGEKIEFNPDLNAVETKLICPINWSHTETRGLQTTCWDLRYIISWKQSLLVLSTVKKKSSRATTERGNEI